MNTGSIEVEIEKPLTWSRILKIKVPPAIVEEEREKVLQSFRKKAKIPGFRHGKAPADIVSRRFKNEIKGEAIEVAINRAVEEALEQEKLNPITRAAVGNVRYEDGKPLEFEARFDIKPDINLQRYTKFKVKREKPTVTDEEVDAFVQNLRVQRATFHEVKREAKEGDMVTIDYTPNDSEKGPLLKQKVSDVKFVLGDQKILPDMERAVYRKTANDEFTVGVNYPEDYHREELRGKTRDFLVTLRSVAEKIVPEVNAEFLRALGEFADLGALKTHVGEDLLKQKEREIDQKLEESLIDNIIEANPFDVPQSMVNAYLLGIIRELKGPETQPEEISRLDKQVRPIAEREVKKGFIFDLILKKEGLEPVEEELEAEVERLAGELGKDPKELKGYFVANSEEYDNLRRRLARKKAFEFLVKNTEIVTG